MERLLNELLNDVSNSKISNDEIENIWKEIQKKSRTKNDKESFLTGSVLGIIHLFTAKNIPEEQQSFPEKDWETYIRDTVHPNKTLEKYLLSKSEILYYVEKEKSLSKAKLPFMTCRGLNGLTVRLEFENCFPYVGYSEIDDNMNPIENAICSAVIYPLKMKGHVDTGAVVDFFDGYLSIYDNCFRAYEKTFGLVYGYLLNELEDAIKSSLDGEKPELNTDTDKRIILLVTEIERLRMEEESVKTVLENKLRPVEKEKYDNHDSKICFYELLFEKNLENIPEYALPKGYKYVPFSSNDRDAWITIEKSAKEFNEYEQGISAWNVYFEPVREELPNRMIFIENENGEKVATATALYDVFGNDKSGDGWLHWVSVKREYQGKGLSKPLITHVLHVMKNLGYTHAKIPTQTNTWLACKIYMDLGFIPVNENIEESFEGWRIVKNLTGHKTLDNFPCDFI